MAKRSKQTQSKAQQEAEGRPAEEVEDDTVPQPDDDNEEAVSTASADAGAAEGGDDEPEREEPKVETARDRIAQRYREIRAGSGNQDENEAEADGEGEGEDGAGQQPQASVDEPKDEQFLDIVVDGKAMRVERAKYAVPGASEDTIKAIAQREIAADNRLTEANRLVDEAKAIPRQSADQPGSQDQPQPDRSVKPETKGLDDEKLDDIVQRIQVGDQDDARNAIREVLDLAKGSNEQDQQRLDTLVESAVRQRETQSEIDTAVTKFGEDNPDILEKPHLANVGLDMVVEEMVSDIRKLGVTDDVLKPLNGNHRAIAAAYRDLRLSGHSLRTYDQVLEGVATKMREEFNLPKPEQPGAKPNGRQRSQTQNRVDADPAEIARRNAGKAAAQPQPRSAGARDRAAEAPRPKSREQIRQEAVQRARKQRGFVTA